MSEQTPADRTLLDYLVQVRDIRDGMQRPSHFIFSSIEAYVLAQGTRFTPSGLPAGIRPMRMQQCFENAWRVANRAKGSYHYVEGFALGVIPIYHAWVIDRDGNAYDPTWAHATIGLGGSYFGVELNLDEVRLSRRSGALGLLENWQRDYPALQGVDVLAKDAWFKR